MTKQQKTKYTTEYTFPQCRTQYTKKNKQIELKKQKKKTKIKEKTEEENKNKTPKNRNTCRTKKTTKIKKHKKQTHHRVCTTSVLPISKNTQTKNQIHTECALP